MNDSEPYLVKVSRYHPNFMNRSNKFFTIDDNGNKQQVSETPIPNDLIICDGCNDIIVSETTFLLCFKRDGQTYVNRCVCNGCKEKYYNNLKEIDETDNNVIEQTIQKLTEREKNFAFNFFSTKTDNKHIDRLNFQKDLVLYHYQHSPQLLFLFDFFKFCDWWLLITLINRLSSNKTNLISDVETITSFIEKLKKLAKKAQFKVNEFLDLVDKEY